MQEVPKIVRERLKAGPPRTEHPDADVLTAYAESSLSARERNSVLVHLSSCVDCRDIVALALPPTEAAQLVVTASRGWLSWPALRWGFVSAGIVAIASVGFVEYQRGERENAARLAHPAVVVQEAKNETSAPVLAQPAAEVGGKSEPSSAEHGKLVNPSSSAARDAAGMKADEAPHLPPNPALAHPSVHLPQRGGTIGGLPPGGPMQNNGAFNNGQIANQQQNNQWQVAVQAPQSQLAYSTGTPTSATPTPSAGGTAAAGATDKLDATGATLAQNQPAAPLPQDEAKVVTRSKQPEMTTVEVASAAPAMETSDKDASRQDMPKAVGEAVNGRSLPALVTVSPSSQLRWTISSSGTLQRSYDQGSTWLDVNVIASLVPTSSFGGYDANALTSLAKAQPVKKEKRVRKQDVPSPVFRTVTANSSEVWAGGSNASLYHSTDAGDHWMRVVPSSGSVALTGDVVALEFLDSQHGKVTTSTPEVWTTADAGQTWQKQ